MAPSTKGTKYEIYTVLTPEGPKFPISIKVSLKKKYAAFMIPSQRGKSMQKGQKSILNYYHPNLPEMVIYMCLSEKDQHFGFIWCSFKKGQIGQSMPKG